MWKQFSFMLMVLIGLHLAKADDCLENELKCRRSEQCYPKEYRCDGYADCDDGTDECQCEDYVCSGNRLTCPDDTCGKEDGKLCNGRRDCPRGKDEVDCESCVDGAFHCSVEKKCIPIKWRCDGMDDCNGEDEMDCADFDCPDNKLKCPDDFCGREDACVDGAFHCSIEKKCIPSEWHCDGYDDCDGEDELDCTGPPPQEPARSLHKAHGQRTKKDEGTVHTVAREQRRKKDEDTVHTITREQRRKKDESKVHTVSREQRRKKDEDTVARSNKDIDAHRKFLRRGKSNLKDNLMNYLLHRKTDDRLANRILSHREMDKRRPRVKDRKPK
ncbi:Hypothetical predicted protein [Mytilus galloprovincialis]|uniref:Uncharacterized protein n=1 Tax=Mytilus galloprovincialis TaxID=29158 RepID=A0A8B6CXD5_MYTGA|nr:Hypothetical predicted protein [Mytilus galloprovincialis]